MSQQRTNLASLVNDFSRHGSQIAVVLREDNRNDETTYGQLATLSRRFAAELVSRRIFKGDRVLIWGENGPEWIAAFFGCVLRGVLPVPIDSAGAVEFARQVEQDVSPKLIAADARKIALLSSDVPALDLARLPEVLPFEGASPANDLSEDDALQIVFTSGTTGQPKGVVHTHKNVLASLRPIETEMGKYLRYERFFHPIRFLHTLPLSHVFGQFMGLWIPPLLAAEVHYESRLAGADILRRIKRERISVLVAVPRVLDLLRRELTFRFRGLEERTDASAGWSALKRWWKFLDVHRAFGLKFWAFVCGGASLPPAGERFWNALGFVVIQGYGMTETTALVSVNHPFHAAEGSVGKILPGREVRIAEDGEVLVRGETISNLTWQNGSLHRQDSEWLATGDLAEFDKEGNLRFRGRKKDVIVTAAGLNIYPEDLESALKRQTGVRDASVFEVETESGPAAMAALLLESGADGAAIVEAANRELAAFQQMGRWVRWPESDFPRTSTGKVLRRELARIVQGGGIAQGNGNELNLDSLGRVELQSRLEQQYGVSLDDASVANVRTEQDVRELVADRQGHSGPVEDSHVYPHWPWKQPIAGMRDAFLELAAMPLTRFLAKPVVRNQVRQFPPAPMLIVANHVTSYDVPFLLYALPGYVRRRLAVAMSGEMILDWRRARNQGNWALNSLAPFEYWLVTALFNIFPLPQYSGFRRSFAHAEDAVKHGYSVIVFPEGRRSGDGTPQPFKQGAGLLWKQMGTPALAMRTHGLGELKAHGGRWFRSGRITVSARALLPLDPNASPRELTEKLRAAVFD
ncbi:MAG TPA: AMP-binding protein [Bryobacteraceae bacterium]|nr:AMP-binding protein [Bryobacteraceae bacterium]